MALGRYDMTLERFKVLADELDAWTAYTQSVFGVGKV